MEEKDFDCLHGYPMEHHYLSDGKPRRLPAGMDSVFFSPEAFAPETLAAMHNLVQAFRKDPAVKAIMEVLGTTKAEDYEDDYQALLEAVFRYDVARNVLESHTPDENRQKIIDAFDKFNEDPDRVEHFAATLIYAQMRVAVCELMRAFLEYREDGKEPDTRPEAHSPRIEDVCHDMHLSSILSAVEKEASRLLETGILLYERTPESMTRIPAYVLEAAEKIRNMSETLTNVQINTTQP